MLYTSTASFRNRVDGNEPIGMCAQNNFQHKKTKNKPTSFSRRPYAPRTYIIDVERENVCNSVKRAKETETYTHLNLKNVKCLN